VRKLRKSTIQLLHYDETRRAGAVEIRSQMASINYADPPALDEVDERIVELLKLDGRATNQQIARRLKIAAATVSARIRRLEQTKAVRVVAVTDFAALGFKALLALGIEVQGRAAEDVGIDLAALEEVFSVHLVTGARDIEVLVALRDLDVLRNFLLEELMRVPGIRSVSTGIAAEIVKFNFDVAPMT
jgi:Lrp/AsnC family leucine-responsive transcriptional regulator